MVIMCQETEGEKTNLQFVKRWDMSLCSWGHWQDVEAGARIQDEAGSPQEGGPPGAVPAMLDSLSLLSWQYNVSAERMGYAINDFGAKTFFSKLFIQVSHIQKSKQIACLVQWIFTKWMHACVTTPLWPHLRNTCVIFVTKKQKYYQPPVDPLISSHWFSWSVTTNLTSKTID